MRRIVGRLAGTLGCLLMIGVVVALVAGAYAWTTFTERIEVQPSDAVRHYLQAIDEEDYARAHELLCAEMKRRQTRASLAPFMRRLLDEVGGTLGGWNVEDFPYSRGEGRVGIYFEVRASRERRYQAYVVREGDRWRICELRR